MRLRKCDTDTEHFDFQRRSYRKTAQKAALVSRHIGTRFIVVAQCNA